MKFPIGGIGTIAGPGVDKYLMGLPSSCVQHLFGSDDEAGRA